MNRADDEIRGWHLTVENRAEIWELTVAIADLETAKQLAVKEVGGGLVIRYQEASEQEITDCGLKPGDIVKCKDVSPKR